MAKSDAVQKRIHQILYGVGFGHHSIRQAHSARVTQAERQLHPLEAPQPELALEVSRRATCCKLLEPTPPAKLPQELTQRRERLRFDRSPVAESCSRSTHCS